MLYKMGTIGDEMVNSDSVNLGSNPSSPATQKPREVGTSDDFGPLERPAESEQSEYGRSTRVGTAGTLDIPTDPKAFERWMDQHYPFWPMSLSLKANRALQSLRTQNQKAWDQSFALRKLAKADWSAFTTAYAQWEARS